MQRPPQFSPALPPGSSESTVRPTSLSASSPPPAVDDKFLQSPVEELRSADDDDAYVLRRPPRTESAGWGMLIAAFGVATVLLAVAVGVLFAYRDELQGAEGKKAEGQASVTDEGSDVGEESGAAETGHDVAATETAGAKFVPTLSPAELDFRRETLAPYLLVVRSDGAAGPKAATGILAEASGAVAVPMSIVRGAEVVNVASTIAGRAERVDGGVDSPGAVAVDREADWALIAAPPLPGTPVAAIPRAFDKPPEKDDRLIVAGSSERGQAQAFECEVRETPTGDSLDSATKRALESRGWNVERFDWRRVGPVGAPLRPGAGVFSLDGAWIGLVASRTPDGKELLVATGPELSSMFAAIGPPTPGFLRLDAGPEAGLATTDPVTSAPGDLAASDPAPSAVDASVLPEAGAATGPAETSPFPVDDPAEAPSSEEAGWTAAAADLGELVTKLEASGLYAESLEEYLDLTDLGENLTTNGQRVAKAPESAGRTAWEAERDRALELLATRPWEKDFAAAAHNELVGTHVDAIKGIFFYGEVTAAKDEIIATGGTQPILFQAIGRSDQYVVEMTKNADEFVKGSKWIVVGLADPRTKIILRTSSDDPGTPVPILEAKYVVGRPDAATAKPDSAPAKPDAQAEKADAEAEGEKPDAESEKPDAEAEKNAEAEKDAEANKPDDASGD